MSSYRLPVVVCGHLAFAGSTYATWAMGQQFAPEMMSSQVMIAPLVIGIVGIWVWYGFWAAKWLRGDKTQD